MAGGDYGTHLDVYDWSERRLLQRIDLGQEGVMPLEIRCVTLSAYAKRDSVTRVD